jgi:hypothetical protein
MLGVGANQQTKIIWVFMQHDDIGISDGTNRQTEDQVGVTTTTATTKKRKEIFYSLIDFMTLMKQIFQISDSFDFSK